MINKETISSRIKNIIKNSGLTYSEVSQKSGLSQGGISKWTNGVSNINLIDYIKICQACGEPNGVFDEREMKQEIPAEISEELDQLIIKIVELHSLCIGDKSPVHMYLEDVDYWLPIMREMAKKDPIPYKIKEPKREVAEKHPNYGEPIENDDAFKFQATPGLAEIQLIKDNSKSIRKYSRACAGYAGNTEETPEYLPYYAEDYKGDSSISLIEVIGDSMHPLIKDGDTLIVRELSDHPRITSEEHVPLEAFREKIPHGAICILNLDDHGQEVKQIFYRGRTESWGLTIKAANPEWGERILRKGQSLVIYGIVLGKAKF